MSETLLAYRNAPTGRNLQTHTSLPVGQICFGRTASLRLAQPQLPHPKSLTVPYSANTATSIASTAAKIFRQDLVQACMIAPFTLGQSTARRTPRHKYRLLCAVYALHTLQPSHTGGMPSKARNCMDERTEDKRVRGICKPVKITAAVAYTSRDYTKEIERQTKEGKQDKGVE